LGDFVRIYSKHKSIQAKDCVAKVKCPVAKKAIEEAVNEWCKTEVPLMAGITKDSGVLICNPAADIHRRCYSGPTEADSC
jgi:hypothetical protein